MQAHTGITEGTLFRDQGWCFYQLGRLIERADQTTRLLDIRYHLLVPAAGEARRVAEMTQWGGVLRAAAGHHAFRRVAPPGFTPADVVAFLLADTSFPRSVGLCIEQIEWLLSHLRTKYRLRGTAPRWSGSRNCAPPCWRGRSRRSSRAACISSWTACSAT